MNIVRLVATLLSGIIFAGLGIAGTILPIRSDENPTYWFALGGCFSLFITSIFWTVSSLTTGGQTGGPSRRRFNSFRLPWWLVTFAEIMALFAIAGIGLLSLKTQLYLKKFATACEWTVDLLFEIPILILVALFALEVGINRLESWIKREHYIDYYASKV